MNVAYNGRIQYFPKYSKAEYSKINDRNAMYIENDSAMIDASRLNKAFRITDPAKYIFHCPENTQTNVKLQESKQKSALEKAILTPGLNIYQEGINQDVLDWLENKLNEYGGTIELVRQDAVVAAISKLIVHYYIVKYDGTFTDVLSQDLSGAGYPGRSDVQNFDLEELKFLKKRVQMRQNALKEGGLKKLIEIGNNTVDAIADATTEASEGYLTGNMGKSWNGVGQSKVPQAQQEQPDFGKVYDVAEEVQEEINRKSQIDEEKKKVITSTINDILSDATPGRETKGKTQQWEKSGGFDNALKDYDKLNPENSRDIQTGYGTGKTGTLSDGSKINARPGSSYGDSTLEIQKPNGLKIKIRYGG